jgi:hypothetical protein
MARLSYLYLSTALSFPPTASSAFLSLYFLPLPAANHVSPRSLTQATDTKNIWIAFNAVKETIYQRALRNASLL